MQFIKINCFFGKKSKLYSNTQTLMYQNEPLLNAFNVYWEEANYRWLLYYECERYKDIKEKAYLSS